MPPAPGMFSMMNRWPSFSLSLSAMMRVVTSATPPAPNGRMILTGFSGHFACAGAAKKANAVINDAAIAKRRAIAPPNFRMCVFPFDFFIGRIHKASPGYRPANGVANLTLAQIGAQDQPDRPRPPHGSRSDGENRYPTAPDRALPSRWHARWARLLRKAASISAPNHRP